MPGVHAGHHGRLYLRRWTIEDVFAWTKTALGWEDIQVLNYEALRTLVALSWVAAAYVFTLIWVGMFLTSTGQRARKPCC
ncbi:transposase [Deinococcus sp.]|uniref:transposase n=1 Tax=Deinococcus sp. TaxID=47478 RepID=UPI0028699063|nr:transposase [Deinococcus sp.]